MAAALLTDTGWLRFSNADARVFRTMARLVDDGAQSDELYRHLEQADRPERLMLRVCLLESLELHYEGRLAVMTLPAETFQQTCAKLDETENLINEAMRLATVEVAILLVETEEQIRVSFRSRRGKQEVDVSALAARFGGGGHVRAAGCKVAEDLQTLKPRILQAAGEMLGAGGSL